MNHIQDGIKNILDCKEENTCEFKDTAIETTQSETWRGKHLKKSEHQLKDFMCT